MEKSEKVASAHESPMGSENKLETGERGPEGPLKRQLKNRHISMIRYVIRVSFLWLERVSHASKKYWRCHWDRLGFSNLGMLREGPHDIAGRPVLGNCDCIEEWWTSRYVCAAALL
jgi:hypothetical protein